MPPWPTSKYQRIPMSWANSRARRPSVADAASLAGWKWSWTTARRSGFPEVRDHHSPGQYCTQRVDDPLSCNIRGAAVDRLEEAPPGLRVEVGRGGETHPADQRRGQVAQDVAEQVAGHDDLELGR